MIAVHNEQRRTFLFAERIPDAAADRCLIEPPVEVQLHAGRGNALALRHFGKVDRLRFAVIIAAGAVAEAFDVQRAVCQRIGKALGCLRTFRAQGSICRDAVLAEAILQERQHKARDHGAADKERHETRNAELPCADHADNGTPCAVHRKCAEQRKQDAGHRMRVVICCEEYGEQQRQQQQKCRTAQRLAPEEHEDQQEQNKGQHNDNSGCDRIPCPERQRRIGVCDQLSEQQRHRDPHQNRRGQLACTHQ